MDLIEIKNRLSDIEEELINKGIMEFSVFETPHGKLAVHLTNRLRRRCRKGKIWKSNAMLTALKNATYGYNPEASRSRGGADGIFLLDRSHRPENIMMKKIFDQFIDKPDSLLSAICEKFDIGEIDLQPVRLVSHHMRLLGIMVSSADHFLLVLVDYDNEKGG